MKRRIRKSSALMFADPFALVIGLDGTGKAEGEVYVDDGESFEFVNGGFVHRRFEFDGKVLVGTSVVQGSVQKHDVLIEQIRIVGLSRQPRSIVEARGTKLRFDWEDEILTIHRPQILVGQDFKITFNF
jgi:alpha 1,3-glucosidase